MLLMLMINISIKNLCIWIFNTVNLSVEIKKKCLNLVWYYNSLKNYHSDEICWPHQKWYTTLTYDLDGSLFVLQRRWSRTVWVRRPACMRCCRNTWSRTRLSGNHGSHSSPQMYYMTLTLLYDRGWLVEAAFPLGHNLPRLIKCHSFESF